MWFFERQERKSKLPSITDIREKDILIGNRSYIGTDFTSDSHAIVFLSPPDRSQPQTILAVVAKGRMGYPYQALNKLAAEIVVTSFIEVFSQTVRGDARVLFTNAVETAANKISQANTDRKQQSILALCAAILVQNGKLYTVSVGNCRIYFWRQGKLRQISIDHTTLQWLLETGQVTHEELESSPGWDGLPFTRCLGGKPYLPAKFEAPDFRMRLNQTESNEQAELNQGLLLRSNDCILLCTDGLIGSPRHLAMVKDEWIGAILSSDKHPQQMADELIDLGRVHIGELWDITAIVLKVQNGYDQ